MKQDHQSMESQMLNVNITDGIGVLTINNPPLNSLPGELLKSLEQSFEELAKNKSVKVVILTGSGKAFAIGVDIDALVGCASAEEASNISRVAQEALMKIEQCPKPVIAAISGFCMGGGLELALSCHMRFASDRSIFGMPELRFGLIPAFGGSYRLPATLGTGRALQMILSSEKINSQEAKSLGIENDVFPADTMMEKVRGIASKMTNFSSASMRMAINAVLSARFAGMKETMDTESSNIGKLYDMHDLKEGVYAYLEKRKPNFIDS